ncbi:MAG: hypothetical protein ABL958_04770 [Bdellovibrionia bacterium]
MKFALVNEERREAEKGISGSCIGCEQLMIPKCGPIKVKHWAHKTVCECDHWWENETEWHRTWKNFFPIECQEIRHKAESGEWHIADVVTKQGHFLEFQHSFLKTEEREARNKFYGSELIWVVDGLRRKNDQSQFDKILKDSKQINPTLGLFRLPALVDESSLLSEWFGCSGPVFFDFGLGLPLWILFPGGTHSYRYVGPFSRQSFVELLNRHLPQDGQKFSELMKVLNEIIFACENPQQYRNQQRPALARKQPVLQRQIVMPRNLSRRILYNLNRSPRRGRF